MGQGVLMAPKMKEIELYHFYKENRGIWHPWIKLAKCAHMKFMNLNQ